jgi:hypothetical protein
MKNKGACRAWCGVVLGLVGLFMLPGGVLAGIAWQDTFDGYSDGNLGGKGAWLLDDGTMSVGSAYDQSGSGKGVRGSISSQYSGAYTSDISAYTSGANSVSFWIKVSAETSYSKMRIMETDSGSNWIFGRSNTAGEYWRLQECVSTCQNVAIVNTQKQIGTWMFLEFEGNPADGLVRARANSGEWSAWGGSGIFTQIKNIVIDGYSGDYFYIDDITISTTEPESTLTLDFQQPPDESSTPDFSNWALNYQYYTGTTTPLLLYFNVRVLTEAGNYIGDSGQIKMIIPDSTSTETIFIPKSFVLPGNKWYNATANFWISPENILATSTSHFIVSTTSSAIWEIPPTSTTTSAGFVLTCDPDSGFFTESLCHLGLYLFIPKYEDFSSFLETWDNIKNKIPIGYFTASKTALESLTTETEGSVSFSSLGEITDYIKTFFTGAFWLLFVFWAFNRIRNLEI